MKSNPSQTTSILGICAVLPQRLLTNSELEERFGTEEIESITKIAGIRGRRVAGPGQCASDLALTAAERLLTAKNIDRSRIDLLLFVSQSSDYRIPPTAAILQAKLGLPEQCAAFDINQACSAYPYALSVAHSMIVSGVVKNALVLNADTLTALIHPLDRALVALHGDGACATLLGPSANGGFETFSLGTDGTRAGHLLVPAGASRRPSSEETRRVETDKYGNSRSAENLYMDGAAIFHFSLFKVPKAIRHALEGAGMSLGDIDLVILHQANRTMMEMIYKSLKVPAEKQFFCLESMGNCSGPSAAVALFEAWRLGRIRPGSRTLVCSFGAGLSWGTAVIRWPEDSSPLVDLDPVLREGELLSAAL
ncbi:MAG TPA: ketoacyl-ACP synthase III [Bryobacteraceae bacterium]|nr:ketoacyl-ACP synthase III [Bryobacteraceae bacterium]